MGDACIIIASLQAHYKQKTAADSMAHEHIYVRVTSFASSPPAGPFPQLREMLDKPSPRRSDARKKRRAVGSAAPRKNDTAWLPAASLLIRNPSPMAMSLLGYCSMDVST